MASEMQNKKSYFCSNLYFIKFKLFDYSSHDKDQLLNIVIFSNIVLCEIFQTVHNDSLPLLKNNKWGLTVSIVACMVTSNKALLSFAPSYQLQGHRSVKVNVGLYHLVVIWSFKDFDSALCGICSCIVTSVCPKGSDWLFSPLGKSF